MRWDCAQEKAAEEREALGKMRKQKRKSADLEPDSAARAVISLTASSHASTPDAPRCSLGLFRLHSLPQTYMCIGKNRPQRKLRKLCLELKFCVGCRAVVAAQSIGSTAQQWPVQQQSHSRLAPALQHTQPSLFTVSAQAQHAEQASLGPAAQGPSGLRLQLPLRAAQQHQLQAHLQLQHQAQIDFAIGSLAEKQVTQASSSTVEQQRPDAATCAAPSSWAQRLTSSQVRLESSCGAQDSSATGTCSSS